MAMAGTSATAEGESGYESDIDVNPIIKGLGRMSLEDDGERDWHEESKNYLKEHYEGWQNLNTTIMAPPCLQLNQENCTTGQETEKKIFDLLNEFGKTYKEPMFVVHSYNFSELINKLDKGYVEKEWIKGEHDFVIIHRQYGVIFLEVKSKDTTKGEYKKAKEQIEKARNATLSYLKKRYGKSKKVNVASHHWPGFVVMPNCKKQKQTTPKDDVVYEEDCSSPEAFKQWWDDKIATPAKHEIFNQEEYKELVIRFVPFSCLLPTLNLQIDRTHENIVTAFTPRQLQAWYCSSPVQWFSGPAGSGKTVLLIEKVKEIASNIKEKEKNERILVLCFNVPLSIHLQNEINGWFRRKYKIHSSPVKIKTYDAFIKELGGFQDTADLGIQTEFEMRRNEVEANYLPQKDQMYAHIFVDEGQDLSGNQWPKLLQKLHHKPNNRSRYYFWVMFDSNQHVQFNEFNSLPWEYLQNASQLKYVFRNTGNIFSLSKKYYEDISEDGGEIKLGHKETGLDVCWDQGLKLDRSNRAELVAKHIQKLQGGSSKVKARDITVLARTGKAAISLDQDLRSRFQIGGVNAEIHLEGTDEVTVESVRRFKGLESKVVILCDPKCYPGDNIAEKTRQLIYTAVSRCFCYLIIVSTPDGCNRIKNVLTHIPLQSDGSSSLQKKRKDETSFEEFVSLESEHRQVEGYAAFSKYGKRSREDRYDSGPPERKAFVDKTDRESSDDETISPAVHINPVEERQIMRDYERGKKSKRSRPVDVDGSDLLEPGDEFIKDNIRAKAFPLLEEVVKKNLTFTASNVTDEDVKKCVAKMEYSTYQEHRAKHNPGPYTKAMRKLKRDVQSDNGKGKLNSEVGEALK